MPILYKSRQVKRNLCIGFRCDRCKKEVKPAKDRRSPERFETDIELQEMFHWETVGGYGSMWGDGAHVELTLCQKCAFVVFGEHVVYKDETADNQQEDIG